MVPSMKTPRKLSSWFLAAAFGAVLVSPAAAASGEWAHGQETRARLYASSAAANGTIDGAIAIALPSGWKTYWRSPGTAGVSPEFDFSASHNFDNATVAFPVPEVVDDGFSVTNVYVGGVVLPFHATVIDPAQPVEIAVTIHLGVCKDVCVPDDLTAHLVVPPGEDDPATAAVLATARARVPGPAEPGVFAVDSVARAGGTDARPVFRVAATVPGDSQPEFLVEGPDDWSPYTPTYAGSKDGKALFDVKFSRLGAKTPIAGARIHITMATGGRAVEQTMTLD
jgi:DsbC/DsbD-like thiol-disulfide interchange protein